MSVATRLMERMQTSNTLACCGLDPDLRRIPLSDSSALSKDEQAYRFLLEVIQITGPHVCAYKAQKAFFDLLPNGHDLLTQVVADIHRLYPGVPVFIDCKIGDIDNTMQAYAELIFDTMQADGVLVNPYMGDEVLDAFANYGDRGIIVLARTSNQGAAIIQDAVMNNGQPLWQYVLELIVSRWNKNRNMIPVVSSTAQLDMQATRRLIPQDMPILLAGVGAQGGDYADLATLLNKDGLGVFVNSSRALLYPERASNQTWQQAIEEAVVHFKDQLNEARASQPAHRVGLRSEST